MFPTSFTKLNDGSWGVRIPMADARDAAVLPFQPGQKITVTTRGGDSKVVVLAQFQGRNRYGDQVWSLAPQAKPAPVAAQAVGDLTPVLTMFRRAQAAIKAPAVVLGVAGTGTTLRITVAGPKAKVPGSLTVCDDGRFVQNDWGSTSREWLGRVTVDGQYQPARAANGRTEAITAALVAFAKDPAGEAAKHGKATGRCCFCNRRLGEGKDQRSVAMGYGPDCAKRFGVVWGESKETFLAEAVDVAVATPAPQGRVLDIDEGEEPFDYARDMRPGQ